MLKKIVKNWRESRWAREFEKAVAVVEAEGFTVVQLKMVGSTTYILGDPDVWHKIGRNL